MVVLILFCTEELFEGDQVVEWNMKCFFMTEPWQQMENFCHVQNFICSAELSISRELKMHLWGFSNNFI